MGGERVTRRRLLRRAAGAGAGAAAALGPTIVPSWVAGASDGRPAPSGRINMAFVGVGGQGTYVMGNLLGHKEVQGIAVCDCDPAAAGRAKEAVERKHAAQV